MYRAKKDGNCCLAIRFECCLTRCRACATRLETPLGSLKGDAWGDGNAEEGSQLNLSEHGPRRAVECFHKHNLHINHCTYPGTSILSYISFSSTIQSSSLSMLSLRSSGRLLEQIMAHTPSIASLEREQFCTSHIEDLPSIIPHSSILLTIGFCQMRPYFLLACRHLRQPVLCQLAN